MQPKIVCGCLFLPCEIFWEGFVHVYSVVEQSLMSSIGQNILTKLDMEQSISELEIVFLCCYLASLSIYCIFWGNAEAGRC